MLNLSERPILLRRIAVSFVPFLCTSYYFQLIQVIPLSLTFLFLSHLLFSRIVPRFYSLTRGSRHFVSCSSPPRFSPPLFPLILFFSLHLPYRFLFSLGIFSPPHLLLFPFQLLIFFHVLSHYFPYIQRTISFSVHATHISFESLSVPISII